MSLVSIAKNPPAAGSSAGDAARVRKALAEALEGKIDGELRFDVVSQALYSTDASVYQIQPLGVVLPKSREDIIRIVETCRRLRCPLTMRGGGTSQAGQAIGEGLIVDTSKYYNRILEINAEEQWVRVEPGIVLDELNAQLRPYGLRFAPDVSTASRATIGGMMANNSSGARSVFYGKTIDHVIEQHVVLSDGSVAHFRPLSRQKVDSIAAGTSLEAACYRTVQRLAGENAEEVEKRFPKVLRRVGGYNLDEFTRAESSFNLAKLMVGSEGTLGVVLEAKLNLVPLPKAKAVVAIQFQDLLGALEATPAILRHRPSAVEVMDGFILDHTKQSPALERLRNSFIEGNPGALLCVEFYDDTQTAILPRLDDLVADLQTRGHGYRFHKAIELSSQARIWSLREAALGLSMSMKDDAKSLSFVEDTAVSPERLRDYIDRFLEIIRRHETSAGVYAHASVGCLHVRPVVNLKTSEGVRKFESIAEAVSDLVLEFGGALSGEHGDGLVRSPFMEKMFGPVLYNAFRAIKHTFDPDGIFNPGKIVDAPPLTANLRFGADYRTPAPETFFDFSDYGGMGVAVEMCSGLGACRKKLEGTMCPSYMATRDEMDSTRGRANALRLAMNGRLAESGFSDDDVYRVLDLCLECRACKAECPVGVDVARFKSEFLAGYWNRHGTPLPVRALASAHSLARWGSPFARVINSLAQSKAARSVNERLLGLDRRRTLPRWSSRTFTQLAATRTVKGGGEPQALIFNDTFTNYYDPDIGIATWDVLEAAGIRTGIASNACCGRPLISKGLLAKARDYARKNVNRLYPAAAGGKKLIFCEPSCLSAVREDVPSLLRGDEQHKAQVVADASFLFEEFLEQELESGRAHLDLRSGPKEILLHGHCHQKSMGLLNAAKSLVARAPGSNVVDPDAGCCGMAGSFGYSREHFEVSRQIGERKLFPVVRKLSPDGVVVASGTSCRHQMHDFTGVSAIHPAQLLKSLVKGPA